MRNVLFALIIIFISIPSHSQDIIVKKDGTSIKVKVKEIGTNEIEYLKHEKLDGPIYIILKKDVVVVYFEDGSTEIINANSNSEKSISLEETKEIMTEYINDYAFSPNSKDKKSFEVSFEGDYIRLSVLSRSGSRVVQSDVFDFTDVYKFGEIDKRKKDWAFLNIWVSRLKNEKRNKWEKYKLVLGVNGHNNAELINDAFKHYKQLILEKNGNHNKFNND